MALWRDPLDELIADLERSVSAAPVPDDFTLKAFQEQSMGLQLFVAATDSGDPEALRRIEHDPRFQAWVKCMERLSKSASRP